MKAITAIFTMTCLVAFAIKAEDWPGFRFPGVIKYETTSGNGEQCELRIAIDSENELLLTYWVSTRELIRALWIGEHKAIPIRTPSMPLHLHERPESNATPIIVLNVDDYKKAKIEDLVLVNILWKLEDSDRDRDAPVGAPLPHH